MPLSGETIGEIVKASADPAANNELVFTADEDLIVHSLAFTLVTDANVANRFVRFTAEDTTGAVFFRTQSNTAHVASTTTQYSAFEGSPLSGNSFVQFPLPAQGLQMRKGDVLRSSTVALQVGDNFGVMALQVEHF